MTYPFENIQIAPGIRTLELIRVDKMEDVYLGVHFAYPGTPKWNGAVPLHAKYQGIDIPMTRADVEAWVLECYEILKPANASSWRYEQKSYLESKRAEDTKLVFDALNEGERVTRWLCRKCGPVSDVNPQPASRIRQLKMYGYHIVTQKKECSCCGSKQYFDLLIRLPRHSANSQKRSTITRALRERILSTLENRDCVTEIKLEKRACVIDHKFPSSRWVIGESVNETSMPESRIRDKFQILSNQSNLQKERYCQRCVIEGLRGDYFGIQWYYKGDAKWRGTSKADEDGCVGCPWYDVERWKIAFNLFLQYALSIAPKDEN